MLKHDPVLLRIMQVQIDDYNVVLVYIDLFEAYNKFPGSLRFHQAA